MKLTIISTLLYLSVTLMNRGSCQASFLRYLQSSNDYVMGTLDNGKEISSSNGLWKMGFQTDGNLVLKDLSDYAFWTSNSIGKGDSPYKLVVQDDGNLVIYDSKAKVIWATNTNGKGKAPFKLAMQTDANLVLIDSTGASYWATNTKWAVSMPSDGCVWIFSDCNFKGSKTEYCNDNPNLDKSASSILFKKGLSLRAYGSAGYTGTLLEISNPMMCLKAANFDKKMASLKFTTKSCASNEFLSSGN